MIHFIWAGGSRILPPENLLNIIQWKLINPQFKVFLWVDFLSSPEFKQRYEGLYSAIKEKTLALRLLRLTDILHFKDIHGLRRLVKKELSVYQVVRYEIDRFNPNYGVSSDLLRYEILSRHGGVYFDSDVCPSDMPLRRSDIFTLDIRQHRLYVDSNSQGSGFVGNDAFICTQGNPIIRLIRDQALNNVLNNQAPAKLPNGVIIQEQFEPHPISEAYFKDDHLYRRTNTPSQTGPAVVRTIIIAVENEKFLRQQYQIKYLNQHTMRFEGENAQSWLSDTFEPVVFKKATSNNLALKNVIERAILSIAFEVEQLGILRFPEYIKQCQLSLMKSRVNISFEEASNKLFLMLNNSQINFSHLSIMQWDYQYHDILLAFAQHHHIDHYQASGLFPNEKNQYSPFPALIECATSQNKFGNIQAKESGLRLEQAQYGLRYLEDSLEYLLRRVTSGNLIHFLELLEKAAQLLNGEIVDGHLVKSEKQRLAYCQQQLESYTKIQSTAEFSHNGNSSSFWRSNNASQQGPQANSNCCTIS